MERHVATKVDANPNIVPIAQCEEIVYRPSNAELLGWRLECLDAAAQHDFCPEGTALEQLNDGTWRLLKVGRAAQPPELWERILPDEAQRNTVSRVHFEILYCTAGAGSSKAAAPFLLKNCSGKGTFVNGVIVHQSCTLRPNDVVAMGEVTSEYGSKPALHLKFLRAAERPTFTGPARPEALPTPIPASMLAMSPGPRSTPDRPALDAPAPLSSLILQCVDNGSVPPLLLSTAPGVSKATIRVGRASQPMSFWEVAVPNVALRNAVSREHFEVHAELAAGEAVVSLTNRSSAGTVVNGRLVRERISLSVGDVVAVPRPREAGEGPPIVQFCLGQREAAAEAVASPAAHGAISPGPPPVAETPPRPSWKKGSPAPQAPQDSAAVVKISFAALPPPFALSCTASQGLPGLDLSCLPPSVRVLEASCLNPSLRVGRGVQPPAFWASLLPDEGLRKAIAHDHFEVSISDNGELMLKNLSPTGTLLNGKRVIDWSAIESGDVISVSNSLQDNTVVISFIFRLAEDLDGGLAHEVPDALNAFTSLQGEHFSLTANPFDSLHVQDVPYNIPIAPLHVAAAPQHGTRITEQASSWQPLVQNEDGPKLNALDVSLPTVPMEGKVGAVSNSGSVVAPGLNLMQRGLDLPPPAGISQHSVAAAQLGMLQRRYETRPLVNLA